MERKGLITGGSNFAWHHTIRKIGIQPRQRIPHIYGEVNVIGDEGKKQKMRQRKEFGREQIGKD